MKSMKNLAATMLMAVAVGAATQAHAGLVLDLTSPGAPVPCGNCGPNGVTFGWEFTVNSPITIDGIGVWDSNQDGPFSTMAGLYTAGGALLQSVTITTAGSTPVASANPNGQWLFQRFSPMTLSVGSYLVGSVFGASTPLAEIGAGVTTIPQITLGGGVEGTLDGGLTAPTDSFDPQIYGPTLELAPAPEPATWAMLMLGMGAMGGVLRRRRTGALVAA